MSAINKELYDALREGNISEETAAKAARSVLNEKLEDRIEALERRMSAVETRLAVVETKLEDDHEVAVDPGGRSRGHSH